MKLSRLVLASLLWLGSLSLNVIAGELYQRDGVADPDSEVPEELNLSYALSFALDNNHAIRQARERIKQQEGVVLTVSSLRLPTVAASGNYTRYDKSLASAFSPSDRDWAVQVQATQVLYAGGGVMASSKSASFARSAA